MSNHTKGTAAAAVSALAEQFQIQGIRHEPHTNQLWCALCTVASPAATSESNNNNDSDGNDTETNNTNRNSSSGCGGRKRSRGGKRSTSPSPPQQRLEDFLCLVGRTTAAVLSHCSTRAHLLQFEASRLHGLQHWCPVQLHGERVLLDHHCLYPSQSFGPGRMISDETMGGGTLLGQDVCGGVRLWPRHRYVVVELVLPQAGAFVTRARIPDESGEGSGGGAIASRNAFYDDHEHNEDNNDDDDDDGGCNEADGAATVDIFYPPASVTPNEEEERRLLNIDAERNMRVAGARRLPSYYRQRNGVKSLRLQAVDISQVLRDVNGFIRGEAEYRKVRTERFARENL